MSIIKGVSSSNYALKDECDSLKSEIRILKKQMESVQHVLSNSNISFGILVKLADLYVCDHVDKNKYLNLRKMLNGNAESQQMAQEIIRAQHKKHINL